MTVDLVVVEDAHAASAEAAALLVDAARAGGAIALPGGTTPRAAYAHAAVLEPDWRAAEIWLGDERMVPAGDSSSNARLVRDALLAALDSPPGAHFVDTSLPAEEAAAAYDRELRAITLDIALLGLGPDGHTASLFPHSPALDERERLAVSAEPGLEPWVERVTMTIPALCAARHVVFLAVGRSKAEAARRAFAEPPSPATPASLVRSATGRTTAILDAAAAAEL